MVLSDYAKQRIIVYDSQGKKAPSIAKLLENEGIVVSRIGVYKFLLHYRMTGSFRRRDGSGRPNKVHFATLNLLIANYVYKNKSKKVTSEVKAIVEERMQDDDETTASQLHKILTDRGYQLSKRTIIRCRVHLGWTFRGSAYCQLIRDANKVKRLEWARMYLGEAESGFTDVIWTDESSIQMEAHKRFCYRKAGQVAKNKPRYVAS